MNREVIRALEAGAMDALRLSAALLTAPYYISKAFVTRPLDEPFRWRWDNGTAPSVKGDAAQDEADRGGCREAS